MKQPKFRKYKKAFKGRIKGTASNGNTIVFGDYALKALTPDRITLQQLESCRKAINRRRKREGKLWIRMQPDLPVSKKPADVRMGKGKGSVEYWAVRVKPGKVLFELSGVSEETAFDALALAAAKLPIKTKIIKSEDI